jgi:microcystin-dependent protein
MFLYENSGDVFRYETPNWNYEGNIRGAIGPQGEQGVQGNPGPIGPMGPDSGVPVGSVTMWMVADPPNGWQICNGQSLSRTQFAELYAILGDTFGAGDGSTTFNVPDFDGRFPLGAGPNPVASKGGVDKVNLTLAQMPSHNHTNSHTHTIPFEWVATTASTGAYIRVTDIGNRTGGSGTDASATSGNASASTGYAGSGADVPILNPFLAVHFIIKAEASP